MDITDNVTVPELNKLMQESKNMLRAQIAFVVFTLGPIHSAIVTLQEETREILDIMQLLHKYALYC